MNSFLVITALAWPVVLGLAIYNLGWREILDDLVFANDGHNSYAAWLVVAMTCIGLSGVFLEIVL